MSHPPPTNSSDDEMVIDVDDAESEHSAGISGPEDKAPWTLLGSKEKKGKKRKSV